MTVQENQLNILKKMNMETLGGAMAAFGVALITANYSGSGDSGAIDRVEFFDKSGNSIYDSVRGVNLVLPYSEILQRTLSNFYWDKNPEITTYKSAIEFDKNNEKIEVNFENFVIDTAYSNLSSNCDGWEINEGSEGNFSFTLEDNVVSVELNHREFIIEHNDYQFLEKYTVLED